MVRARALVVGALVLVAGVIAAVALIGGDEDEGGQDIAAAVEGQLSYVDPGSSLVAAVDMRFEGENWGYVRALASRVLREYRSGVDLEQRGEIPPNLSGALEALSRFAGLSFEDDVKPLLDGHLVIGVVFPPREPLPPRLERLGEVLAGAAFDPRRGTYVRVAPDEPLPRPGARAPVVREADGSRVTEQEGQRYSSALRRRDAAAESRLVLTYRANGGNLRRVVDKVLEEERPRELSGYDDTRLLDSGLAMVGDDTLVLTDGGPNDGGEGSRPGRALRAALDRNRAGRGYPMERLAAAEHDVQAEDPLVVAAGTPTLARAVSDVELANDLFDEADLDRARREVPYLGAVRGLAASLDLSDDRASGRLRIATDRRRLRETDLPLARAGGLDLPATNLLGSASRNQSVTTSFAAGVVRSLFSGSDFVRAVEDTERELGIRFEEEVLRQFDCPSISVFDARRRRFGARSCLRDPRRMRALLPRLRPHLPRIVRSLQGLGDAGMLSLLLVAPDAPSTPSLPLGQIVAKPLPERRAGARDQLLYEMTGLHDNVRSELARSGPERVVFGMIGDRFVVASDRAMAGSMADLRTRRYGESAATAIRAPSDHLITDANSDERRIASRVIEELVASASADRSAFSARAELILAP